MKTEFSNAEKVSNRFLNNKKADLSLRFEDWKQELVDMHTKMKFDVRLSSVTTFANRLDTICSSDDDNYVKLSRIIHLEREFDEYLRSKAFVVELFDCTYEFIRERGDFEAIFYYKFFLGRLLEVQRMMRNDEKPFENLNEKDVLIYSLKRLLSPKDCAYEEVKIDLEKQLRLLNLVDVEVLVAKFDTLCRELFRSWALEVQKETGDNFKIDLNLCDSNSDRIILLCNAGFTMIVQSCIDVVLTEMQPEVFSESSTWFFRWLNRMKDDKDACVRLAKKQEFWGALAYFKLSGEEVPDDKVECVREDLALSTVTVDELLARVKSKLLYRLDLSCHVLTSCDLDQVTIIDCDLTNTGARINIGLINRNLEICYVKGQKVDRFDFRNCSFKGCTVELSDENVARFLSCKFSVDTFDEITWEQLSKVCKISKNILKRYFAGKNLTKFETFVMMLERGS